MTDTAIDTSVLMSILLGEPDAERMMLELYSRRGALIISAGTLLEAHIVAEARMPDEGARALRELLQVYVPQIVPVTAETVDAAFAAWRRYGRGHHSAALNFGDCFAYALAKLRGVPLMYKGDDFSQTDIASAL